MFPSHLQGSTELRFKELFVCDKGRWLCRVIDILGDSWTCVKTTRYHSDASILQAGTSKSEYPNKQALRIDPYSIPPVMYYPPPLPPYIINSNARLRRHTLPCPPGTPSSPSGGAATARWTRTAVCPPSRTGAYYALHSSSLSAGPNIGEIKERA